jgi:peptidylprolyl isomerase
MVDPKATEGTAAIGTMPAATGPSTPLYALRYIDLKIGDGELAKPSSPAAVMLYTVHYTGWLLDGTKFDSSVDRGEPITFPVGLRRVISGWDTGFEGMHVGGRRRLIVPWQLAYGAAGNPPVIPEKADLVFDVELISQQDASTAQPARQPSAQPAEKPEEHPE